MPVSNAETLFSHNNAMTHPGMGPPKTNGAATVLSDTGSNSLLNGASVFDR